MADFIRIVILLEKLHIAYNTFEYYRYWYYYSGFTCINLSQIQTNEFKLIDPSQFKVTSFFDTYVKQTYVHHFYNFRKNKENYYKYMIRYHIYKYLIKKRIRKMHTEIYEILKNNRYYANLPLEILKLISNKKIQLVLLENGVSEEIENVFLYAQHYINNNNYTKNRRQKYNNFINSVFV